MRILHCRRQVINPVILLGTLLILSTLPRSQANDPAAPTREQIDFFEKKVRPILADNCFKCHSQTSDKLKGGLLLDARAGLLKGGESGPAVVPGDPDKSLLFKAIDYDDVDLKMPPKGKLTGEQIATLKQWVKLGAPWPADTQTTVKARGTITDEDRKFWSFQPVANPTVPDADDGGWSRNPIDHFIFARLKAEGLKPARPAKRVALLRRVTFDLIGLPPTPEEIDAFVADKDPHAYEHLIDRLLASPRYGERWARHWLDLVRYAESDGYRIDEYRGTAWRYRDYVIRSLNEDKPYDRFVREQLAGDELFPDDPDALTGTSFLRLWIYEYNQRDVRTQWSTILNDITDVTGDVFLGLGMGCARCHDHKFDPILQKDYYRLQAFFAPMLPVDDRPSASARQQAEYQAKLAQWEAKTADIRQRIADIERPHLTSAARGAIDKFPEEIQVMIRKPVTERTPLEHQLAELAYRQVLYEFNRYDKKLKDAEKQQLAALRRELAAFDNLKPAPLPVTLTVRDAAPVAPPTVIPKKENTGPIEPGFLTLFDDKPAVIPALPNSTGRRSELARWLTRPDHPLTTRVIVNRIWQYHFGRGLVETSSDFGRLGEMPSHPELLDWLATRFVQDGWSFKKLHRLILTSAAYQQSAAQPASATARLKDPDNRLLWRMNPCRLEAEQIRDSMLAAAGELDLTMGGPSVDPIKPRRTIYTRVTRNTRDSLLDVFDAPDAFSSTADRRVTTTPTQSLLLINSQRMLQRARALADRLYQDRSASDEQLVSTAYRLVYGRTPAASERSAALAFLEQQRKRIDPKQAGGIAFQLDKMPYREGKAALMQPDGPQPRLQVADNPSLPTGDFTIEAFVLLRSVYEDASVRTIASHWSGDKQKPGWSLGVTSKKSKYKPETLVLQLMTEPGKNETDYEALFSGLHVGLNKPYFVAVTAKVNDTSEDGVTFYTKDLSNDDEPMLVAHTPHKITKLGRPQAAFTIGGHDQKPTHTWDGLIDDVRLSKGVLRQEQLLLTAEGVTKKTVGYWQFEATPGVYKDSSPHGNDIQVKTAPAAAGVDPRLLALVDFCHVLLNSNEFLYVD